MQTSNELLSGILHVVTRIDERMAKDSQGSNANSKGPQSAVGSITGKIASLVKKPKKENKDMSLGNISDSLPNLVEGMKSLSNLDSKKVNASVSTLKSLFGAFDYLGDPKTSGNIDRAAKSLLNMSDSLTAIAKPLSSISKFFIMLGVGIVTFAGSLFLAGKIFQTTPLGSVLIVVTIMAGMVGAFYLLGKIGKGVEQGINTAQGMGKAMAYLSLGILAFSITLAVVPAILGVGGGPMAIGLGLLIIVGVIVAMTGVFVLLGLAEPFVKKGVGVASSMAIGMAVLALGVLAVAMVGKIIGEMAAHPGLDGPEDNNALGISNKMVSGLGVMGIVLVSAALLFLGLGAAGAFLLPGMGMAILMGGAMILTALAVRELVKITSTMDPKTTQTSISDLLSSTLLGFSDGVSRGLLGEKSGSDSGFFSKLGTATANTAKILAGVALISGVAVSLSLFAMSLRAFESIGTILPIIGHDAQGKPQFGKPVGVLGVSTNIANSISTFFTTLSKLFGPDGGMPAEKDIEKITNLLMGKGGLRIFGFDILRSGPNLMDALFSFAKVLKVWGEMAGSGTIPLEVDPETGRVKEGPKTIKVAEFIADTVGIFMRTLVDTISDPNGKMPNMDELSKITNVLMGSGGLRLFGFDVARTSPNLMDALMKFGEVLDYWGKFGEAGEVPIEFDDKGKATKGVKLATVAKYIASSVGEFMRSLSTEIPAIGVELQPQIALMAKILLGEQASSLWKFLGVSKDVPGILEPVAKFGEVVKQFASGQIPTGKYDEKGNPIYEPIDYQKTANNIVNAIKGFTMSLSTGLQGLSKGDTDYEKKALAAGAFLNKFETMFEKLEKLSTASTGLEKLAGSLSKVGAGIGEMADNLERLDADKLEKIVSSTADYEVKTKDIPPSTEDDSTTTLPGAPGKPATDPADWNNISQLIGTQVGQEVSKAIKRGQFKFEFDTSKSGGVYYWDPK